MCERLFQLTPQVTYYIIIIIHVKNPIVGQMFMFTRWFFYNKFIILGMVYRNIFLKIILRYYKTTFKKKYNIFFNFLCVPISIFMFLNFRNKSLHF